MGNESTSLVHGHGYVDLRLNTVNDNIGSTFMSTSKLNDSILWHARLSYVYFKRMQDMSKDGLILAFDMDTEKCKTCMLNKITKKPFQNVKHETKVLELIHSDLSDLHATPSLGNKKYFVTFIDDALRFCYVYLLHSKDKALDKFKVFKTEVELQQGSLIKRFRTDKEGEYMDTLYFQSVGIIHEMNAPYTPQQNGISERKIGTVVRLPDPKLKTLGKIGIKCIFVGYVEHYKAFRFYVIEPNDSVSINSIIESRDAIFNDNRFSSVPRPNLRILNRTKEIGGLVVPKEVTKESLYIEKVLKKFKYFDCTPISTPMDTSEKLMPNNGQFVSQLEYSRVISCLMYAITCTMPGIALAVGKLSRSETLKTIRLQVAGYSCLVVVQFLELPRSKLVSLILLWVNPMVPISIRCDSASTLAKAYSQMYNGKSRYLGVRHSMIRELITNGVVFIKFVRSQQNLADHLTKGLARELVIKKDSMLENQVTPEDKEDRGKISTMTADEAPGDCEHYISALMFKFGFK
ncbi:zinc finger, CCHC-type containing protein [Tanacetum coccineum]